MSPRARYLRDRADFLSRWADRILADRPSLTRLPTCPTCGEPVAPAAWDRHQTDKEDPPVRRCEDCGKPCTYPLGCAGCCLRCMLEKMHHNPGLYGRPTTKGKP